MTAPRQVKVVEVGPRDGLQNQPALIPAAVKIQYIALLAEAGFAEVEATSFVHPERVPQLADAEEVLAGLDLGGPTLFSALVPNARGLNRALKCGVRRIAVFTAASETFNRRNIGMGVEESLQAYGALVEQARDAGLSVRGYVSTCFGCPYEGEVPVERVIQVAERLLRLGVDEVSLGDTIGVAVPRDVLSRLSVLLKWLPRDSLALHFHDTSGTALANVVAALEAGVATFDSSAGGIGGCPFAPGAAGNLATEDLIYLLDRTGYRTGVDLEKVAAASAYLESHLSYPLPGKQYQRLRARSTACSAPES